MPLAERMTESLSLSGLYKALSESGKAKVLGDPTRGVSTRIQGPVDLNEVARRLLSLAS